MNDVLTPALMRAALVLCVLLHASGCSTASNPAADPDSVEARVKPYASDYQ